MTSSYSSPKHHSALTVLSYICIVCDHAATFNFFSPSLNPPAALISWSYSLIILAGFFSARFWHGSININLAFIFPFYITFPPKNTSCKLTVHQQREGSWVRNQILLFGSRNICIQKSAQLWLNGLNTGIISWNHNSVIVFRKTKQSCTNYG